MPEYNYTQNISYWTGYGDEALAHLHFLKTKKRTAIIHKAIIIAEFAIRQTKNRLIALSADPRIWSKYDLD